VARARKPKTSGNAKSAANVGYDAPVWLMADAVRGAKDATVYKHARLGAKRDRCADLEDPDENVALNIFIFRVPLEARRSHLKTQARPSVICSHDLCF
jgi:type I restriction enzyme M protein